MEIILRTEVVKGIVWKRADENQKRLGQKS